MSDPIMHDVTWDTGTASHVMTSTANSDTIEVGFSNHIVFQLTWGNGQNGFLWLEASLDKTNWAKDHNSAVKIAGADTVIFNQQNTSIPFYRVHYEFSNQAGSPTLTGKFYRKPLGKG